MTDFNDFYQFKQTNLQAWQSALAQAKYKYNIALIIVGKQPNNNLQEIINQWLQQSDNYQLIDVDKYDKSDNGLLSPIFDKIDKKTDRITNNVIVMRYLFSSEPVLIIMLIITLIVIFYQ